MSETKFTVGLSHFQRGNFYAARECWLAAWESPTTTIERARLANALGAVTERLNGRREACRWIEQALDLVAESDALALELKCLANLSLLLARSGETEEALRFAETGMRKLSPIHPVESCMVVNGYAYALRAAERNCDVLQLDEAFQQLTADVSHDGELRYLQAVLYSILGTAADAGGNLNVGIRYLARSWDLHPAPATAISLAQDLLFSGRVEEAYRYVRDVPLAVWQEEIFNEKVTLGASLQLVATFAHHAGRLELCKKCLDKAELYYGQNEVWPHWMRLRGFEDRLYASRLSVEDDILNWAQIDSLIDELNLMDSLEAMFPKLMQVSQLAAPLAHRLVQIVAPMQLEGERRNLQVAARLAYLGLTVLTSAEDEAVGILRDSTQHAEISQLGAKVLAIYPASESYRTLISMFRCQSMLTDDGNRLGLFCQCLAIAFSYIEMVHLFDVPHSMAVEQVVESLRGTYHPSVIEAFIQAMIV